MSSNVRLSHGRPRNGLNRAGLTLVEMLVATALTLILFGAVAEMFARMGASVNDARSTIELSGNLRTAGNHLRRDLNNVSVKVGPWVYPGSNQGYFQIIEGPDRDIDFASKAVGPYVVGSGDPFPGSLAGDADDIVSFTAYSKEKPFVGLIQGRLDAIPASAGSPFKYALNTTVPGFTAITSHYAEVVYFTKLTPFDDRNLSEDADYQTLERRDPDETVTLFRRVLLIRPDIDVQGGLTGKELQEVRNDFDLSVGAGATNQWQTNSLERLQDRRYRVGHMGPGLVGSVPSPFPLNPANLFTFEQLHELHTAAGTTHRNRTGEDVLMRKVLAFDVKVFDQNAVVQQDTASSTITVLPGDREYADRSGLGVVGLDPTVSMRGAFVDLFWGQRPDGSGPGNPSAINTGGSMYVPATNFPYGFAASPHPQSNLNNILAAHYINSPSMLKPVGVNATQVSSLRYATYDTWPYAYLEGSNAANGFDDTPAGDPGAGIVDSLDERQTAPPYPVPLRGMQITIRAIEEGTRIIRQDTVTTNFMPR